MIYDRVKAEQVLKDLRIGLKTGNFTNWNKKGNKMSNNNNNVKIDSGITEVEEIKVEKKEKDPRGRKAAVSDEVFGELWEKAEDLQAVVTKLSKFKQFSGQTPEQIKLYASMRATNLRKVMALKKFKRGRPSKKVQVVAE